MSELSDAYKRSSRRLVAFKNLIEHLASGSPNLSVGEMFGQIHLKLAIIHNDLAMMEDRGIRDMLDNVILTVLERLPEMEEKEIQAMTLANVNQFLSEVIDSQTECQE